MAEDLSWDDLSTAPPDPSSATAPPQTQDVPDDPNIPLAQAPDTSTPTLTEANAKLKSGEWTNAQADEFVNSRGTKRPAKTTKTSLSWDELSTTPPKSKNKAPASWDDLPSTQKPSDLDAQEVAQDLAPYGPQYSPYQAPGTQADVFNSPSAALAAPDTYTTPPKPPDKNELQKVIDFLHLGMTPMGLAAKIATDPGTADYVENAVKTMRAEARSTMGGLVQAAGEIPGQLARNARDYVAGALPPEVQAVTGISPSEPPTQPNEVAQIGAQQVQKGATEEELARTHLIESPDQNPVGYYAQEAAIGAPVLGAAMATGPAGGAAIFGASAFGQKYGAARAEGEDVNTAATAAGIEGAVSAATARLSFGRALNPASLTALRRISESTGTMVGASVADEAANIYTEITVEGKHYYPEEIHDRLMQAAKSAIGPGVVLGGGGAMMEPYHPATAQLERIHQRLGELQDEDTRQRQVAFGERPTPEEKPNAEAVRGDQGFVPEKVPEPGNVPDQGAQEGGEAGRDDVQRAPPGGEPASDEGQQVKPETTFASTDEAEQQGVKDFGRAGWNKLKRAGVETEMREDLDTEQHPGIDPYSVQEHVDNPGNGPVKVVADNNTPSTFAGNVAHGIVHNNDIRVFGTRAKADAAADMFLRLAKNDPELAARIAKIPADTPPEHYKQEVLARAMGDPYTNAFKGKILDNFKIELNKAGLPKSWIDANPAIIRDLARANVRHYMEAGQPSAPIRKPHIRLTPDVIAAQKEAREHGESLYAREDVTQTPEFKNWFGQSKITDEKGVPKVLYHGTTGDFDTFDRGRANIESDFGKGFYFTDTRGDVAHNYANEEGPDLSSKIERLSERIMDDQDVPEEEARKLAKQQLASQHSGATMPVHVKMENPIELGSKNEPHWDYEQNEDTGDESGDLVKLHDALMSMKNDYHDWDPRKAFATMMDNADPGREASRYINALKLSPHMTDAVDDEGNSAVNEIVRRALQKMGYDGIIDKTVDKKFGSQRRVGVKMAGMTPETTHYIAFEPEQVKSAIGNRTFDPNNRNILYSRVEDRHGTLEDVRGGFGRGGEVDDRERWQSGARAGQYVGAPEKYNTPAKIPALHRLLHQLTSEGESGRHWYRDSGLAILRHTGGDLDEARKLAKVLSIYSPQAKVDANTTMALHAWEQYKAGQPIKSKTGVQDAYANRVLYGDGVFEGGEKTKNFYNNLMRSIDPEAHARQGVTNDMWMMRAFGYGKDTPTDANYRFVENETNRIAKKLGWSPEEVQAAIWVAMKARAENPGVKKATEAESTKRGYMRYNAEGEREVLDEAKHGGVWFKHAIEHEPTAEDTRAANYHFGDALDERTAQLNSEYIPSRTSGQLPEIHDAPLEQKQAYSEKIHDALTDENGRSLVDKGLGLRPQVATGTSGFEGKTSPGVQQGLPVYAPKGIVSALSRKLINLKQAIEGYITHQDAMAWYKPVYGGAKSRENGVQVNIGRRLTSDETEQLYRDISAQLGHENAPPIPTLDGKGFAVLNFPEIKEGLTPAKQLSEQRKANDAFHDAIKVAVDKQPWKNEVSDVNRFQSDGEYHQNDWRNGGEQWRQQIRDLSGEVGSHLPFRESGRSDIFDWIDHDLRPRVDAANADAARQFGWSKPEPLYSRSAAAARNQPAGPERAGGRSDASRDRTAREGSDRYPAWSERPVQKDAVTVRGVHYSNTAGLDALDGRKYGTNHAGAEAARLSQINKGPLHNRVYFYPEDHPLAQRGETMVGRAQKYGAELRNIYDARTNDRLQNAVDRGQPHDQFANDFERAVVRAGFDGYRTDNMVTVLGSKGVKVAPHSDALYARGEGKPHIKLKTEEPRPDMGTFGNANARRNEDREARGQKPLESTLAFNPKQVIEEARARYTHANGEALTNEVLNHPRAMTPHEEATLLLHGANLRKNLDGIHDQIDEAKKSGNTTSKAMAEVQRRETQAQLDANDRAVRMTGSIWSGSGQIRQQLVDHDLNIANVLRSLEAIGPVSPAMKERAADIVRTARKAAAPPKPPREQVKDLAKQFLSAFKKPEPGKALFARIDNPDQVDALRKMAKLLSEEEADPAKVIDQIHDLVKESGVSKGDISDALSKPVRKTKAEELSNYQKLQAELKDLNNVQSKYGTPESRRIADAARNRLKAQIADLDERLKTGDNSKLGKMQGPEQEDIARLRATRDAKQQELENMQPSPPAIYPEDPAIKRNQNRQLQIAKEMAAIRGRIQRGEFEPGTRIKPKYNDETARQQRALDGARADLAQLRAMHERQQQGIVSRVADLWHNLHMMNILSSVAVFPKLAYAVAGQHVSSHMNDIVGSLARKIPGLSQIYAKSARHGQGWQFAPEKEALTKGMSAAGKGALEQLKYGQSDLERRWADHKMTAEFTDFAGSMANAMTAPTATGRAFEKARVLTSYVGRSHAAIKEFIAAPEFYKSLAKRQIAAARDLKAQGWDPTRIRDHLAKESTMAELSMKAMNDALESKMQGKNVLADSINDFLVGLERRGEGGRLASFIFKSVFPIRKVPLNIAKEVGSYAFGGIKAAGSMMFGKGDMTEQRADYIAKNINKQGTGLALMAAGYVAGSALGGAPGFEHRDKNAPVAPGEASLGSVNLGAEAFHGAPAAMLQIGATFRKLWEKEHGADDGSITAGLHSFVKTYGKAVGGDIGRTIPYIDQPYRMNQTAYFGNKEGRDFGGWAAVGGNQLRSMLVPNAIQWLAKKTDPAGIDYRHPTNVGEDIMTGIPGLRSYVPESAPYHYRKQRR